jgi:hypothetical protein
MPRVGFEPTIPAFEQAKTVHALDRAATVKWPQEVSRSSLTNANVTVRESEKEREKFNAKVPVIMRFEYGTA